MSPIIYSKCITHDIFIQIINTFEQGQDGLSTTASRELKQYI